MKIRILLTDDDPIMRMLVRHLLEADKDMEVVAEAQNGLEAVLMAKYMAPDIIFMDMQMPVMDGVEAIRRIREQDGGARIIGFSSEDDPLRIQAMLDAGAHQFVSKFSNYEIWVEAARSAAQLTTSFGRFQ